MKITKKKFIGIFGGTFDPVHSGHVQIIENFIRSVHLDELIVLPNGNPPHKEKRIDAGDKLHLVHLALGHIKNLRIDDREVQKKSPSYAYLTYQEIKNENPKDDLVWIMGSDSFLDLENWYEHVKFLEEVNILVLERPGHTIEESSDISRRLKDKIVLNVEELKNSKGKIFFLKINPIKITSTDIRELIKNDEDVSDLLNKEVYDFIKNKNLYRKTW